MRASSHYATILFLTLFSVLSAGCEMAASKADDSPENKETAVPVEAVRVIEGDISAFFVGTASLEAQEEANVVSKVDGIVERIFVEEGAGVKAGQAVAKLEVDRLTLEMARAEAGLAKLRRDYERNKALHEKKLISTGEFERVLSEYETQKAAADLARLSVENATIRAPIDGVVSERMIKVGNMVTALTPTFRITNMDPLLAVMHVPERALNKLRAGQKAEISVDALPGSVFVGKILRLAPVVDPATGTIKVTISVSDPSRRLKPGMFGRVRIIYDAHTGVLLVPREAVVREDQETSVFLVRDSMTYRTVVNTGYEDDQFVEIASGLEAGNQVVTTGQTSLSDSTKIEVIGGSIAQR